MSNYKFKSKKYTKFNQKSNQTEDKKPKFKFEFTKKNIATISAVALGLIFIVTSLFIVDSFAPANPKVYHRWLISTFVGSVDGKDTPNSSHQIELTKDAETGEKLYSCIDVTVNNTNGTNAQQIWVNFSDLNASELNVFISSSTSYNVRLYAEKTFTEKQVRANKDGWFLLYSSDNGLNIPYEKKLKIGFSASVKVREIVLVGMLNVHTNKPNDISITDATYSYGVKPTEDGVNYTDIAGSVASLKNVYDEKQTFKK